MTSLSFRIAALVDRFPKTTALILGLVSATGFAPLNLWPLTLIALAAWMALVARSPRGWRALGIGWTFGLGHFALGLNWIATAFTYQAAMPAWMGWVAVVLLSLYLALYPALAAWGAWWFVRKNDSDRNGEVAALSADEGGSRPDATSVDGRTPPPPPSAGPLPVPGRTSLSFILAFAALWTLTEWLRSWMFSGFSWNPLGAAALWAAWPTKWIGTYGFSALVVLVAGFGILIAHSYARSLLVSWKSAAETSPSSERQQLKEQIGVGAAIILSFLVVYLLPDDGPPSELALTTTGIPITVVQPNVGQQDKWVGTKAAANFNKLASLTRDPADAPPRLILWPEAAIPDYLETGYPLVYYDLSPAQARGRLTNLMRPDDLMLLGALKLELDPKTGEAIGARNAVMTVHPDGSLGASYDKSHLVPYGEYLPMRPLLSALGLSRLTPGDLEFWPGPGARTLDLGRFGKAGIQVCYEIIFSGQVVDRAHRPDFIFNPSNDAWFGSWGPPQHLAQARLRAIEEGLPVVRATPTGISAVIDADGRIVESIPQHEAGRIDTNLPPAHAPTWFARYGNRLPVIFALLLLLAAIAIRRRGR